MNFKEGLGWFMLILGFIGLRFFGWSEVVWATYSITGILFLIHARN